MPQRRLLLIRHAQAGSAPLDRDRPLTEQGARDAAALGAWLADADLAPDHIVVSPARRAGQTWEEAAGALESAPDPVVDDRVYDNTVDALLSVIEQTPEDVGILAVVGHNPSIGALAAELDDGRGDADARRGVGAGFPAGGVAVFDLATSFAAIAPGAATLTDFAVSHR